MPDAGRSMSKRVIGLVASVLFMVAPLVCIELAAAADLVDTPAGRVRICASEDVTFRAPAVINLPARAEFKENSWPFTGSDLRASSLEEGTMPAPPAEIASFVTTAPITLTKAHACAEVAARMLLREAGAQVPAASASTGHIWHLVQVLGYGHWRQPGGLKPLIDDQQIRAVLLTDLGDPVTFTIAQELAADPDMRQDIATAQRMAAAGDEPLGIGNNTEFMAATYRTVISGRSASIHVLIDSAKFFENVPSLQAMGELIPTLTPADVKARPHLLVGTYCVSATAAALIDVFGHSKVNVIDTYCGGLYGERTEAVFTATYERKAYPRIKSGLNAKEFIAAAKTFTFSPDYRPEVRQ